MFLNQHKYRGRYHFNHRYVLRTYLYERNLEGHDCGKVDPYNFYEKIYAPT